MNSSPLTDAHLSAINAAQRNIADARGIMAKAKAANMDVSGHEQAADQMDQALTAYKREFFGLAGNPKKKE